VAARSEPASREPVPETAKPQQGLSPSSESRLVQPSFEEEQLEIPTFLRRQAN